MGDRRDLDRFLVLIVLTVPEPGAEIVPSANLNDLCICLGHLLKEALFEFLVGNVGRHHNHEHGLVLDAPNYFVVSLNDTISLLLRGDQFAHCLNSFVHCLLVNIFFQTGAVVTSMGRATIEPVKADSCLVEADGWSSNLASSFVCPWQSALRPGHYNAVLLVHFHAFDPKYNWLNEPLFQELDTDKIAFFVHSWWQLWRVLGVVLEIVDKETFRASCCDLLLLVVPVNKVDRS